VSQFSANAADFDGQAEDVFTRIAGRYNGLCDSFILFAHRYWKSSMAGQNWSATMDDALRYMNRCLPLIAHRDGRRSHVAVL
jgi:hypothetical protein